MLTTGGLLFWLGVIVITSPSLLFLVLGFAGLLGSSLSERTQSRCVQTAVLTGLLATVGILSWMLLSGERFVAVELGDWVSIPSVHFHFSGKIVFDRLSVPMCILTFLLCGTIGAFANKYLHRDAGYGRFFVMFAMFQMGMVLAVLAGTIELLFAGWEFVGLSSALLVAYFHERSNPVENGLRVWTIYRLSDAAFLLAAVALHHISGEGDFDQIMGHGAWPAGNAMLSPSQAFIIGVLLVIAAAGKSALIPFSGWLPRAMEGPTPSSAVFYGALSVHLGAYLLLRVSPMLGLSWPLQLIVVVWGLLTAVFASLAGRVQTDAKSLLAFASLTQVGIIVAEIGLGLRYLALIHMLGHACLRTLQLLRAPSMLRDHRQLENALGRRVSWGGVDESTRIPRRFRTLLYRIGIERGFLDSLLYTWLVLPYVSLFRSLDRLETRYVDHIFGPAPTSDIREAALSKQGNSRP
jgi:NADH-quinone oxidoreductase subunit L